MIVLSGELKRVIELVCLGKEDEQIALELCLSKRSVQRRVQALKGLYKVKTRLQLAQEYLAEKLGAN